MRHFALPLFLGLLIPVLAQADVLHCVAIAMAPSNSKAALMAKCDGAIAHVDNHQKAESVTIRARMTNSVIKAYTIDKPHYGIADYFPLNDETREELTKMGGPKMSVNDRAYVGEFTLKEGTPLFTDEDETTPASLSNKSECGFEKRPNIASTKSNPDKICLGHVRCGSYHMEVACSASVNGGCPSADHCVDDTSVRLEKAKTVQISDQPAGGAGAGAGNGSGGAK